MKRSFGLLLSVVLSGLSAHARAETPRKVAPGYLSSGFGEPVTNNYGECYLSGPVPNFKPSPDCRAQEEAPAPKTVDAPAPAPVAESAPTPVAPAPAPEPTQSVVLNIAAETLFDFDKSNLRPEGQRLLDKALDEVTSNRAEIVHISVVGHTDWIGTAPYNQKLSERRANAVKAYLASKGVPADRISALGKGKSAPIATNKTAAGRQQNRRAEITFDLKTNP